MMERMLKTLPKILKSPHRSSRRHKPKGNLVQTFTLVKNAKCVMCQVLIKLFKICGYFVRVHDPDDDEPGTKKAKPRDMSLRCDNPKAKPGRGQGREPELGLPSEYIFNFL